MADPPADAAGLRRLVVGALDAWAAGLRAGAAPARRLPAGPGAPRGHFHAMPELFLQLAGRSRFRTPHGPVELAPGSALLIAPLCPHSETVAVRPFANLVWSIRAPVLSVHLGRPGRDPLIPAEAADATMAVADPGFGAGLLAALLAAGDDAEAVAWSLAVAAWLRRQAADAPAATAAGDPLVARVQARIQYEIGKRTLSVPGLAAYAGCSPDHLCRRFRRATGETVVGHLQRQRLEQARLLIADGHPVGEAARLVGFADPAWFSRAYRRRYGHPPSRG
ncbi:MAG: hypothetical protein RLZZ127_783 [Planctomycetota bacterium]